MSSATDRIMVCDDCGVPLLISGELSWESNGVILSRSSPGSRWTFFESENFDPLFRDIEELIGVSIENIVMEARRSESRRYVAKLFPPEAREVFSSWDEKKALTAGEREEMFRKAERITDIIYDFCRACGYAAGSPGELWEKKADRPWRTSEARNPYSTSLFHAECLGACEALEGRDLWVDYELRDGVYHVSYYPAEHPLELKGRPDGGRYEFKGGNIQYELCPGCGVPREISRYHWDLEQGTITDGGTGRRMAVIGSQALNAIVYALVDELGEEVVKTLIEASRRFTKSHWSNEDWKRTGADFQRIFSLRGLGNVVKFEGDRKHLTMRIQNSCLHLLLLGTIQALVELAYSTDASTCSWEYFPDGDLEVTIDV